VSDGAAEPIALGRAEFERLRALVNQRAGLAFDDSAQYLFERRLAERVSARGLASFEEYAGVLETDGTEQEAAFCLLTTKETYFFRQEYQLTAFSRELVPMLASGLAQHQRLTVWSAGCSTGEEAYTIAMLLSEAPALRGWKLRVVGTDLCQRNVDAATTGVYRQNSFRTTPRRYLDQYFEPAQGGQRVVEELRRMCHFTRVNLMNPLAVRSVGRVDVVFCRNVLIYFDERSRGVATDALYQRLLPGGYLLLGHSESLLNTPTRFLPVHLDGDVVYRRPPLGTPSWRPP
jgi:chemotaxis protein methyltransferase CheR